MLIYEQSAPADAAANRSIDASGAAYAAAVQSGADPDPDRYAGINTSVDAYSIRNSSAHPGSGALGIAYG